MSRRRIKPVVARCHCARCPSGTLLASALLLISLLISISAAHAATGTRTSAFAFNPTTGLMTQEVIEPDTAALRLQTDHTYDAFGNRTASTVSGLDIETRTASSTYSADGRFVTTNTNALNQSESWTYDPVLGLPLSHTGPNGLTTTWAYDDLGRVTLETAPDGTKTSYAYDYCSGVNGGSASCPPYGAYVVTVTPLASNGSTKNGPQSKSFYDILDRVIASDVEGFDGSWIRQSTEYDSLGRVARASRPYFLSGGTPKWTVNAYDDLGRVTDVTLPDGSHATYAYHALITATTNDKGQTTTTQKNARDQITRMTDALGHDTYYTYEPFGNVASMTDYVGNVTTHTYDARGRQIASDDPDMGLWTYAYDVLDQLKSQTDAKSQTASLTYDKLGRVTQKVEPGLTSSWTYDSCTIGVGKLCQTTASNGHAQGYTYDSLGRTSQTQTTIDSVAYTSTTTYDSDGRIDTVTYASGYAVKYTYTALGYAHQLKDAATSAVLWTANARDAELHLLQQTAGNGVVTTQTFNANTGLISAVQAGASNAVADLTFGFDTLGNLVGRSDLNQSLAEAFTYDSLNRLTGYDVLGGVAKTVTYDGIGNILSKSDVGTYTYNAAGQTRPHGVQSIAGTLNASYSYDANGNVTADGSRTMIWTSFNMVAEITQGTTTVSFQYDSTHMRFKQTTADGDTLYLKDAGSGLTAEKLAGASGSVKWTEYLVADGGLVGQHTTVTPAGGGSATSSVRYFVLDHLGSVSVITDETGTVVERLSYDAWGKRRFPTGADDPSGSITSQTTRGFTGHEHIPDVGLVNMNGRVQDPYVGTFVSADPIVQDPTASQSLNRYSYVWNNPLSFTDPTGHTLQDQEGAGTPFPASTFQEAKSGDKKSDSSQTSGSGTIYKLTDANGNTVYVTGATSASQAIAAALGQAPAIHVVSEKLHAAFSVLFASQAVMQSGTYASTGASPASGYAGGIETVVVPAQRRDESKSFSLDGSMYFRATPDAQWQGPAARFIAKILSNIFKRAPKSPGKGHNQPPATPVPLPPPSSNAPGAVPQDQAEQGAPLPTTMNPASSIVPSGTQVRGDFPDKAAPNSVLYRADAGGKITHYEVYGSDGYPLQRVDLVGKSHGGIPTPHVQPFLRNVNTTTGAINVNRGLARPAEPYEIP